MKHLEAEIIRGSWSDLISHSEEINFQHYSFDFWNTIAFSNPKFKSARTKYFSKLFFDKIKEIEIINAFAEVGKNYNDSIESGGQTVSVDALYESVFQTLNVKPALGIEEIKSNVFDIFLKYPPLISDDFFTFLNSIDLNSSTISITSNTAFIPGHIIETFLEEINLLNKFSFCIFSDSESVAKPNVEIFNRLLLKITTNGVELKSVIHIGDNLMTDYLGANNARLSAFHLISKKPLFHSRNALYIIRNTQLIPFSREDYSKFKFGSYSLAKKFGVDLFEYFKSFHFDKLLSIHRNIIVYSSPYMKIPTSSYYLTYTFYNAFREYLASKRIETVKLDLGKIERCQTYTEDYGALTGEERFNLIKNDTYKIITVPAKDDLCIFIDDISITGTHQRVVEHLLDSNGIETNSFFLYFAKLSNSDVCPSFENYLNYSFIDEFTKLIVLITSDDYRITTRTTKYILSQNNEDLNKLIKFLITSEKFDVLNELVIMSYANEYHKIELYQQNINQLESCLKEFNLNK
jgi:FMN phosphatase YigB (HAD superfamily)